MSAKASLYAQSLDAVRAQGILWTVPFPTDLAGKLHLAASAQQDGPGQDCRELLRKFTKHNSARELTALTASTEHGLHLLVQKAAASFDADASYGNSFHHSPSSTTNSRGKLPFPPLIARADRPAAEKLISALENGIRTGSLGVGRESENNSAKIVRAWGLYMVGAFSDALEGLQSVARGAAGGGESYDRMLKVLGFAVEGFCHERLDDLSAAMSAYRSAVSLYEDFTVSNGARVRPTTEMDKSAEEVLFRLCWWSRGSAARMSPFPPHRQYISLLAPLYTSSGLFRPRKSLLVHSSLRNLLLASDTAKTSPVEWLKEIESINVSQEVVVRGCTALPRAGSINGPYLGFLEGVVAGWKLSGGGKRGAGEVVRILYAALTHTFQSPRLLRYLILTLTVLGSHVEAGKAVTLYVEMFDKTRETGGVEVSKGLREFAKTKDGEVAEKVTEVTEDEDSDIDSDLLFIETALFGARLRSRFLVDAKGAYALCQRAREIFDEGKEAGLQQNKIVESAIERGLGVSLGALTNADADLETRPTHHSAALSHLSNSIILTPTSWESHFALAYLLFELRQLVPALESAKKAVELNKSNTDCWHLLGLLVCATSRVPGATGGMGEGLLVLETGIEQGEGQPVLENKMEDDDHDDGETERNTKSNGVVRENEGLPEIVISRLSYPAVPSATPVAAETEVPQVPATQSSLPTDETDKLIARVQLRMTKNVVIELMEGAEAALLDQQGLMGYFAAEFASIASEGDERKAKALPLLETAAPRASLSRRLSFRSIRAEATSEGESGSPLRATRSRSNSLRSFIGQSNGNVPTAGTNYSNTSLVSIGSTGPKRETNPRATKLLVQLWLLSAASFRRAGRMEECRGAIAEAEKIDGDDEEVWLQYAQYCIATGASELARTCLIKGLSFSLNHAPSLIVLSRLYLSTPAVLPPVSHSQSHTATAPQNLKLPYAESLLDSLTKSHGWDIPEAWFELSRCYKDTGRTEREKECLVWALQLETTRSVRTLRESVQRVL